MRPIPEPSGSDGAAHTTQGGAGSDEEGSEHDGALCLILNAPMEGELKKKRLWRDAAA